MKHTEEWLTLYMTPGLGSAGCGKLAAHFKGPGNVLRASLDELEKIAGLNKKCLKLIGAEKHREEARNELKKARNHGVKVICWDDADYPSILRNIPNPPALLYVKGDIDSLKAKGIGIVGSRAASSYGVRAAQDLAGQLVRSGYCIISGLALGIDAAAHRGALESGGKTVAILGSGIDVVYPRQNKDLFTEIQKSGAIVSEYPFGAKPESFRFPGRNRIISGLSHGVVIVEAAKRSGSLITANFALEQGKEVFAVPGRVDSPKSEGTHRLLQEGAKLVLNANDIVNELGHEFDSKPDQQILPETGQANVSALDGQEQLLYEQLEVYPKTVDEIISTSGMPVDKVNELMLLLELKGLCEVLPGRQYQLKH